jgi:hypothetical protein
MRFKRIFILAISAILILIISNSVWAAFGEEDVELPRPIFTKDGDEWVAELIPRGRAGSSKIRFHIDGGTLAQPAPKVFTMDDLPDINWKNYWSGFFTLDITPSHESGGKVTLSMSSDFFSSNTDLWGRTVQNSKTWGSISNDIKTGEKNITVITTVIKDGSTLDEDGVSDGKIRIIIGTRDHFWNFAMGALIIRTFGVFLMLIALMVGMVLSGTVFKYLDVKSKLPKTASPAALKPKKQEVAESAPQTVAIEELPADTAAAIGIAVHLYTNGGRNLHLPQDSQTAAAIGLAMYLENRN